MGAITSTDAAEVSDAFLELILADPDLLEVVVASFEASPPQAPPASTTHFRPPPARPGRRGSRANATVSCGGS